jgi:hypothetical protein
MCRRLSATIIEQRACVDAVERSQALDAGGAGEGQRMALDAARRMLNRAQRRYDRGEIVEGWQEVYDARLALIEAYSPEALHSYRLALRNEAREALPAGRSRAVEDLLADGVRTPSRRPAAEDDTLLPQVRADVVQARRILDGYYWSLYLRATAARTQMFFLPMILAFILAALLVASSLADPPAVSGAETLVDHPTRLMWVYAFGALGAFLSVSLSAMRGLTKQNYLLLTASRVNVTRPLVGAASATAVVAILETDLFNLGEPVADNSLILAVAIAAGFSERLLTNAIAAVVHPGAK